MSQFWNIQGNAIVTRKGINHVAHGHPWIYRSDITHVSAAAPGLVTVVGEDKKRIGTAFYSPNSTITLRLLARGDTVVDRDLFKARIIEAQARRQRLLPGYDAYRLIHGEADFLPGIFVDRYADCLVLQTTCGAADAYEPVIIELLQEIINPATLVVRDDAQTRAREGLRQHVTLVRGSEPVVARYHEGEIEVEVDLLGDQKTGGFLDQAINHVAVARYARGTALDCFTYHGGFALQLARVCDKVTAYDISATALKRAQHNAACANLTNVELCEANVFDVLPQLYQEGKRYDTIVLDPPAFASGKQTVDAAMRAYKEVNLRAMRLLKPNSILVSCSCSGRVTGEDFDEMLAKAARDARRSIHFIERRAAGPDHPVLAGVPETDYLKCRVLMVV